MINKKQKRDFSDEINSTVSEFDKSQLEGEVNQINERAMGADMPASAFTVKSTPDFVADKSINAETEFPRFSETERFSFMHEINEKELRENKGLKNVGKTDVTAEGVTK